MRRTIVLGVLLLGLAILLSANAITSVSAGTDAWTSSGLEGSSEEGLAISDFRIVLQLSPDSDLAERARIELLRLGEM